MKRHTFSQITTAALSALLLWAAGDGGGLFQEAGAAPKTKAFIPDSNMKRADIPDPHKWDLKPLFKDDRALEKSLKQAAKNRKKLDGYKGKLGRPKMLLACLELYFKTRLLTNRITLYASLRFDSHNKSTKLKNMSERGLKAMSELMARASFIRQEVLAMDAATMKRAYAQAPKLSQYRPYIDELRRRRAHVLGAKAERVLSLAGDNLWAEIDLNEIPSDFEKAFHGMLTDLPLPKIKDERGKQVQLTLSNLGRFRSSKDRAVRQQTMDAFFGTLKKFRHTLAATMAGQARFSVFLARSRGYGTAIDAYLNKDNIDPTVYRNLIRTIRANLKPLHRYVRLRRKVMRVKKLKIHDLYAPMMKAVKMDFSFDRALKILPAALAPLGEDYLRVLRSGLDPKNGWVDLFPHRHKNSGAFCASLYGAHPYVKMNYYNRLKDLSTLAHEMGHALHSHLSMSNQPYLTASYAPFVAEIASTVNEKLLTDYLVAHAKSDDEKLYILNRLAESIRTTIYRQTLFAEFELAVHTAAEKGTPITADLLNKTYAKMIHAYYGKDFQMGPHDDIEWAYIPHFYYKYYVFTYATGLSSGIALSERIKKGGKKARAAYLGMLRGGMSKPPLELLRGAGVDLKSPAPIKAAARLMDQTVAAMEKLLAKKTR